MQGGLRSDRYRHRLTIEGSDDIETETNREQMPKDGVLPPLAWPAFLAWGLLDFVGPKFQGCKGLGLRAQDMGWDDDWTLEGLPLPVVQYCTYRSPHTRPASNGPLGTSGGCSSLTDLS